MHAPEVLLMDDGELDDVETLLEDMQASCQRLCGGEMLREIPTPRQLLVTTPRRIAALADPAELQEIPRRVVVSEGDSVGMRAQLRLTGFDYLIRRPVHPEALRLLLLRCLYEGDEQREDTRVVVGSPVSFRSGLLTRPATLIDLSVGGCRLLAEKQIPLGRRVRIQLPERDSENAAVTLPGRVVRADEDSLPGSSHRWRLGIAFEALDEARRSALEKTVADHLLGPARMEVPLGLAGEAQTPEAAGDTRHSHEGFATTSRDLPEIRLSLVAERTQGLEPAGDELDLGDSEQRESTRARFYQRVPAFGRDALRVLMGRDLSTRGMRIEPHSGLELGDRIHLAIYGDAEEPPALVWAAIRRDDGDGGLVAIFDPLPREIEQALEGWIAKLPIIEPLQAGEPQSLGVVLSEILSG